MNNENNNQQPFGQFRPSLCFYHASPKGAGSAVKMNLHPAHDDTDGCIMLTIANQMTVGNCHGPNPVFPKFDWKNSICVKLDFNDLTHILQVFRGECEAINDGKGLFHRSAKGMTCIRLRHLMEPVLGYMLEVIRKGSSENEGENRARIFFSCAEALGLCEAVSGAMHIVCFGIPMLVPHGGPGCKAEPKGAEDVSAA